VVKVRVVSVGESRGTSHSLDLTFPPTGLSEMLGEWKGGGEGKGKGKGGETTCITSPHWLLSQIPPWLKWFCEAEGSPDEPRFEETLYPFKLH